MIIRQHLSRQENWLADTANDLKTFKKPMGSSVFVIDTADTYMIDSKGVWHCITSEKDAVECDCVPESTVWNDLPEEG